MKRGSPPSPGPSGSPQRPLFGEAVVVSGHPKSCQTCGNALPDGALLCPQCVAEQSRRACLNYERQFAACMLDNSCRMSVARNCNGRGNVLHAIFRFDPAQAYCGQVVGNLGWRRSRVEYCPELILCSHCRKVFEGLLGGGAR